MIYIADEKMIRIISMIADITVDNLSEIRLRENELVAIYTYDSGLDDEIVPCKWNVFIYNSTSALKIEFDDVEIRFEL